jgi:uncharacterized protein (TIGR02444 family)
MNNKPTASNGSSLWDFAVAVYGRGGVAAACLELQESCHVDVPLFLAVGFAICRGKALDASALSALEQRAGPWRRDVVQALRAIRRRLKTGPHPAPNGASEPLRNAVKAAELAAEKIQLQVMQDFIDALPATRRAPNLADLTAALTMVVAHANDGPVPDAQAAGVTLIAEAIWAQHV